MSAANARHLPAIILSVVILVLWWMMWRESNRRYGTVPEPPVYHSLSEPPLLPAPVEEDGPK